MNVHPLNYRIGECATCETTQKLTLPKQTPKLLIDTGTTKCTLTTNNNILRTETTPPKEISAWDKLYASQFDCKHKLSLLTINGSFLYLYPHKLSHRITDDPLDHPSLITSPQLITINGILLSQVILQKTDGSPHPSSYWHCSFSFYTLIFQPMKP